MPGVVTHHTVPKTRRIFFNHAANNVNLTARFNCFHRTVKGLFGAFNQQAGLLINVAHQQSLIGIAVHSVKVGGDVKIQNVAVLKHRRIGNAVADHLIQRGAYRLRVAAVVHGGGVGAVITNILMNQHINLVGCCPRDGNLRRFHNGTGGDLTGCTHPLNLFRGVHI